MSNDEDFPGVPYAISDDGMSEPSEQKDLRTAIQHLQNVIDAAARARQCRPPSPPKSVFIRCVYDVYKGDKNALSHRESLGKLAETQTTKYFVHGIYNSHDQVVVYERDGATCSFEYEANNRTILDPKRWRYAESDCKMAVAYFMHKYKLKPSDCDVYYINVDVFQF